MDVPSLILDIAATVVAVFFMVGGMAWVMGKQ